MLPVIEKGDRIMLECAGDTSTGTVVVCSDDRLSLTVQLDMPLKSCSGIYTDVVPLVMSAGEYRELKGSEPVRVSVIQRAGTNQRCAALKENESNMETDITELQAMWNASEAVLRRQGIEDWDEMLRHRMAYYMGVFQILNFLHRHLGNAQWGEGESQGHCIESMSSECECFLMIGGWKFGEDVSG